MSSLGIISEEEHDDCELCNKHAELRPYGPNGENVCFDCAMIDEESAMVQFYMNVLGRSNEQAKEEAKKRIQERKISIH